MNVSLNSKAAYRFDDHIVNHLNGALTFTLRAFILLEEALTDEYSSAMHENENILLL